MPIPAPKRDALFSSMLLALAVLFLWNGLYPGTALAQDVESIIRSNDLVYHSVAASADYGAPVGNGRFGGVLRFKQNRIVWQLNHTDFWRFNLQEQNHYKYGARPFGLGVLNLSWTDDTRTSEPAIDARLSLYDGVAGFTPKSRRLTVENCFDMDADCAVMKVRSNHDRPFDLTVELEGWRADSTLSQSADTAMIADPAGVARSPHEIAYLKKLTDGRHKLPQSTQATGIKIVGAPVTRLPEQPTKRSFKVTLEPGREVLIYAAATVLESIDPLPDPAPRTLALLEREAGIPYETIRRNQARWWRDYWRASYVQLESDDPLAAYAENVWYYHLFVIGETYRGRKYHNRGLWQTRLDDRAWGGGSWHFNEQYDQMSMLAANQIEFFEQYYRDLFSNMDLVKAQTRDLWRQPGAFIHETRTPEGLAYEDNRNDIYNDTPHWTALIFSTGVEIVFQAYKYSLYCEDEDYRRDVVYPWLRETCLFYAHRLKKEEDGRYHLYPANAHENFWAVKDPQTDLAAIRAGFPLLIAMYAKYGGDADEKALFEEILKNLAPFPRGKFVTQEVDWPRDIYWYGTIISRVDQSIDMFAPAIVMKDNKVRNFHSVDLYSVYPFEVVLPGDPEYQRAVTTFRNRFYKPTSNPLQHDLLAAALLQLPVDFRENLSDYATVSPARINERVPWGEPISAPSLAVNLMLLQSQRGVVQLFPACPEGWDAAFKLRAEGPLLVESARRGGVVQGCRIECLKDQPIRVRNPWSTPVAIHDGATPLAVRTGEFIEWQGAKGHTYTLTKEGSEPGSLTLPNNRRPNNAPRKYLSVTLGRE